jgi:sulfite exporter TauE/SafE
VNEVLLGSALLMGLFGGAHCVVMCGGAVGVLCTGLPPGARMRTVVAYNAGRVATYAAFGAIAGGLGTALDAAGGAAKVGLALRVAAGVLMLLVGVYVSGSWRRVGVIERAGAPLWRRIEPLARRLIPVKSTAHALALGAVWGFMPCGLVYAALALAISTGDVISGGAAMLAFGAGTLPTLLAMGALASVVARFARKVWVRRGAGLAIAAFGLVQLATATAQAGWRPLGVAPPAHECCVRAGHAPPSK